MKTVLLSLLIVAVVLGARTGSVRIHQKRINDLQDTKFGKTLYNFIALHSAVSGPV